MRSLHPGQILGFLKCSGIGDSGNIAALSANAEAAGDAETQNPVVRRLKIRSDSYILGRNFLGRLPTAVGGPEYRRAEGTHQIVANQICVTERERLSLPVINNGVGGVRAVRCLTGRQQVARRITRRVDQMRQLVSAEDRVLR